MLGPCKNIHTIQTEGEGGSISLWKLRVLLPQERQRLVVRTLAPTTGPKDRQETGLTVATEEVWWEKASQKGQLAV